MVNDESARHVVERLIYLDSVAPGKEISLIINSPGGYVTSGFAIHDTIKTIKSPVSTVCMGLAASMGSILLSAGEKGKRFIYPYAKVMIHQPSGSAQGPTSDIELPARENMKTKNITAKILPNQCGNTQTAKTT